MSNLLLSRVTQFAALTITLAASLAAADYAGTPFNGTPQAIPGEIVAIHYDVAPGATDGISFHYHSPGMAGGDRPVADAIGFGKIYGSHVSTTGEHLPAGGFYLGRTHDGEWTRYTVNVAEAGTYQVGGRFAAAHSTSMMTLSADSSAQATFAIPTTAGFQPKVEVYHVWGLHDHVAEIALPAGKVVLTLTIDKADGLNIERITLTRKS